MRSDDSMQEANHSGLPYSGRGSNHQPNCIIWRLMMFMNKNIKDLEYDITERVNFDMSQRTNLTRQSNSESTPCV